MSESENQRRASRLRQARERLGKNRNQMARALGVSWQQVNNWETGRTSPGPASLRSLAGYLGVTVDHLLARAKTSIPPPLLEFIDSGAPADISTAEMEWLKSAPCAESALSPKSYALMLHALRGGERAHPVPGAGEAMKRRSSSRKAKSGAQRKVSRETALGAAASGTEGD